MAIGELIQLPAHEIVLNFGHRTIGEKIDTKNICETQGFIG